MTTSLGPISDPQASLAAVMRRSGAPVRLRRDPVPQDLIRQCLDAAASGWHETPRYRLIVVEDAARKHQLARIYRQGWSVYRRVVARRGLPLQARQWEADHFEDVPVVIVGCAVGLRPGLSAIGEARYYASVFTALQNLTLMARSLGLSATMSTLAVWSGWQARRTLDLPFRSTPVAVVTLGWPESPLTDAPSRRGVDFAALDRADQPFTETAQSD